MVDSRSSSDLGARRLDDEQERLLFLNWVYVLVEQNLGPHQRGQDGDTWSFGVEAPEPFRLTLRAPDYALEWEAGRLGAELANTIVDTAWASAKALDFGPGHWRLIKFNAKFTPGTQQGVLHFHRMLGDCQNRLSGPFRLTDDVLLVFTQSSTAATSPIAFPDFSVDVYLKAQGPGDGPYSDVNASDQIPTIRALLTFLMGWPLVQETPVFFSAADQTQIQVALHHLSNPQVGYLAINGLPVGLRLLELGASDPHRDAFMRLQGALFAYEQALLQASEFVCIVLFVSAVEALASPNASWRKESLTKRFRTFLLDAAPEAVHGVIKHQNREMAFGRTTNPKRFLEDIYERRSKPLHSGFLQHGALGANSFGVGSPETIRVALISDIVRASIISFLNAPFSSTIGHPMWRSPND